MSNMSIETVKIVAPITDDNPLGYVVVNATDVTENDAVFSENAEGETKPKRAYTKK